MIDSNSSLKLSIITLIAIGVNINCARLLIWNENEKERINSNS